MTNGYEKCKNCGGDRGIHHYQTEQCPVGGREAHYGQVPEWKTSTFEADIPFDPPMKLAKDMTIREYFAAMAMQGLLSDAKNQPLSVAPYAPDEIVALFGKSAVAYADALIEALNKETE